LLSVKTKDAFKHETPLFLMVSRLGI